VWLRLQGVRHDAGRLGTEPIRGYCVSTTLVTLVTAGLAAAHIMRNIEPNYEVLSVLLRDVRTWLVQLVSEPCGIPNSKFWPHNIDSMNKFS
jgi:hypothetical protein